MDNCAKMNGKGPSVLWFRHGLRLHDNPALLSALELAKTGGGGFLAVFIFDGESAGNLGLRLELTLMDDANLFSIKTMP